MTPGELRTRVVRETGVGILVVALLAAWIGGRPGFIGAAVAGAITLANFWWLVGGASTLVTTASASARPAAGALPVAWLIGAGARFLALLVAFAALCATGWGHPVAVVAGLTVLPCDLIALGLRAARD
jgi:ATP synthase I chain